MDKISIDIDGRQAQALPSGMLVGDPDVIAAAREAYWYGDAVPILGLFPHEASPHSAMGVLAALCAYRPGRVVVTEAPQHLTDELDEMFASLQECRGGGADF